MPTYGVARYGVRRYGPAGVSPARQADRAVLGGQAPWMGEYRIAWRTAHVDVYPVNPDTYANGADALGLVGLGCQRTATLEGYRYQAEQLTLVLNDPVPYLPPGVYAPLIQTDALVRAVWTVLSPHASVHWASPVYRMDPGATRTDDALGGGPLQVNGTDFVTRYRRKTVSTNGFYSWQQFRAQRDAALAAGMPPVAGDPEAVATIVAAYLWNQGALGLQVDAAWGTSLRAAPDPAEDVPLLITEAGRAVTIGDLFDYLWNYEPFRLTYDGQGRPVLRPGTGWRGGPWVISRDPLISGTIALPWESLQRTIRPARFTTVTYQVVPNEPSAPPPPPTPTGDEFQPLWGGHATSTSSVNPGAQGLTGNYATYPTELLVTDVQPGRSTAPPADTTAYATFLLAQELGQADTVTVTCDSAIRLSDLGDGMRVVAPPQVSGEYRLVGLSQPFDVDPATLTLEWVADI